MLKTVNLKQPDSSTVALSFLAFGASLSTETVRPALGSAGVSARHHANPQLLAFADQTHACGVYLHMKIALLILALVSGGTTVAMAQQRPTVVPAGWIQQPRQSNTEPLKFTSPDETASLTLYATPAEKSRRSRSAFEIAEGERVTYRRSTPRFVAVSGFRGDRIFYRKSNLACRGTRWHHVALEYAAEDKRKMDTLVTRVAHGMNRFDHDCRGSASETSGGLIRSR